MKFKIGVLKEPKHTDLVSSVAWNTTDEAYSCSDDHKLISWNLMTNETSKIADLPEDVYPTDMHWVPKTQGSKKSGTDSFLLTTADGKFHVIHRSGRIDKTVEAHKGAVLAGRWSYDGVGLASSGEDGQVKIWSRSGMLRSTLAQASVPVYSIAWSPDSTQLLYTTGRTLNIKALAPNCKPTQWKAHEGIILKVAWNPSNNMIVSGGEDCRYKVWDCYGRQLYSSALNDFPITSVAWSPDGELFAVGAYNTLRLCDKLGWSYSLEKPDTGSLFSVTWSSDGTQVAAGCGNGHVLFAHLIENRLEWKQYEATVSGRKVITLWNVTNEAQDKLDFRDRIIKVALGYGHLIVVTTSQCYVYNTHNWNTPIIFDLKEGTVSLILQAEKHFLLAESTQVIVYSYEGRVLCHPRWTGMRPEILNVTAITISNDTLAVRDQNDEKNVHLFDSTTGKAINDGKPYVHILEVLELTLDQDGPPNERQLALLDKNRDLYLISVRRFGTAIKKMKLGVMVQSLQWNTETNMLAAIQETRLTVWYFPSLIFVDKNLMSRTIMEKDSNEVGKAPVVTNFQGNHVAIRLGDGSLVNVVVSPVVAVLHGFISTQQWENALRLCRSVKDDIAWACLAGMALHSRQMKTAEVAYAAINDAVKVFYIQEIEKMTSRELQTALMALLSGNRTDAESILLQTGMVFRTIMLQIQLYNWDRALDLATKYRKDHVETVLAFRSRFLQRMDRSETKQAFLQLGKTSFNWSKIHALMKEDSVKEGGSADTVEEWFGMQAGPGANMTSRNSTPYPHTARNENTPQQIQEEDEEHVENEDADVF